MVRVTRQCRGGGLCSYGPHVWEPLNAHTGNPFRRGRVVYFCHGLTFIPARFTAHLHH